MSYNFASIKQLNYLKHILESENLQLCNVTNKSLYELTHNDIVLIFKKLNVNMYTPNFKNKKYIIEKETDDYIIGKQIHQYNDNIIIYNLLSFKNLLVLDWDIKDNISKIDLLDKIKKLLSNTQLTFLIYETYNGYHAYCISKEFDYKSHLTTKFMNSLECDKFYISYTRKVGFVIRLNKKQDRNEEFIEKFICKINDYHINPKLKFLIEMKDLLIENFN